ncbi:MAG: hypothetical protein DCC49_12950, partial [Acidobacteria bacterium]
SGALTSIQTQGGGTTLLFPNSDGTVSATISPDGVVGRTEYDSYGRPIAQIDHSGRRTRTIYNPDGTVSATIGPDGATSTTYYDAARRPSQFRDPLGATTAFGYDTSGNQNAVTDPRGQTTIEGGEVVSARFSYDQANRLDSVSAPGASGTSTYTYSPTGKLKSISDADGATYSYDYSLRGEMTRSVAPDGIGTDYFYDPAGRMTSSVNEREGETTYAYDPAGRPLVVSSSTGSQIIYQYDSGGRPFAVADSTNATEIEGEPQVFGLSQTLSPGGRRVDHSQGRFAYHDGRLVPRAVSQVSYTYNDDGSLRSQASPELIGPGAVSNTYDPKTGHRTAQGLPGAGVAYQYDGTGRVVEMTTTTGSGTSLGYQTRYDSSGNVTEMGGSIYSYDALGRLVAAHDAELGDDYEYQYDPASNRTEVRKNGELTQALSFTTADEINTALHPEYAYDSAGRLISDTTASGEKRSYHWDGYGRLLGIDLYSPTTGHAENLRLSYDASGRLAERREYVDLTWPVGRLFYHYDGNRLVLEEDMTGTVREYLYAGGEAPAAMRSRNSDGSYSNFFFVTNTHGDVVAVTDRDGQVVNRYAYGPWGEATRVSEQVHQPFRYAGYRFEDGFDLYYLRARWMDPNTGRFLSRDPAMPNPLKLCSLNKYIYTHDNPSSSTDPSGRYPCKQGIYRLGIFVDILADVYVQDDHNVEQVDEFVRQIGLRIAGFPTGHPSLEHRDPPWKFGRQGWNPYYAEDEDEAHHLAAFIVIGYEDYPLSSRQFEIYKKRRHGTGNRQDWRLGDVGRELGTNLRLTTRYRGDPIAGAPAGLTAHDLGSEIVRRLSTGNCDEYEPGHPELI